MFGRLIEEATMSLVLNDREYQSYKDYKFWSAMIACAVVIIVTLAAVSFNDDTMIRPKIEKEFTKNNYIVEFKRREDGNNLNCISKETGGMVNVVFHNNGDIYKIGYALPVEDAYMMDANIRKFKNHINEGFKIVSKYKGKIKKTEEYPAYPISNECFESYNENMKNSYDKISIVDGYSFRYDYLGDNGDNAMFYYSTEIKD